MVYDLDANYVKRNLEGMLASSCRMQVQEKNTHEVMVAWRR